jgi:hypothetical protein
MVRVNRATTTLRQHRAQDGELQTASRRTPAAPWAGQDHFIATAAAIRNAMMKGR